MSNLRIRNSRGKEQTNRMLLAEKLEVCPFCKEGLKKIHRLPILKKTSNFFVTKNAFPYEGTDHHFLIVTKKHISDISKIKPKDWQEIGNLTNWLIKNNKINGGGLFLRFGDLKKTGSTVSHLHWQIISGNSHDEVPEKKRESLKVKLGYKKIVGK